MNKAIVVKATGEILFEGTYDECRASMRPAFMKHIDDSGNMDTFPLHIVDVETEEDAGINISDCPGCNEPKEHCSCDEIYGGDYNSESDIEATDFHNACGDR